MVVCFFFATLSPRTGLRFDSYRAPGWILLGLGLIGLYMVLFFQESYEKGARRSSRAATTMNEDEGDGLSYVLVISVLFVFFSFSVGWSIIETTLTPMARDSFGMDIK